MSGPAHWSAPVAGALLLVSFASLASETIYSAGGSWSGQACGQEATCNSATRAPVHSATYCGPGGVKTYTDTFRAVWSSDQCWAQRQRTFEPDGASCNTGFETYGTVGLSSTGEPCDNNPCEGLEGDRVWLSWPQSAGIPDCSGTCAVDPWSPPGSAGSVFVALADQPYYGEFSYTGDVCPPGGDLGSETAAIPDEPGRSPGTNCYIQSDGTEICSDNAGCLSFGAMSYCPGDPAGAPAPGETVCTSDGTGVACGEDGAAGPADEPDTPPAPGYSDGNGGCAPAGGRASMDYRGITTAGSYGGVMSTWLYTNSGIPTCGAGSASGGPDGTGSSGGGGNGGGSSGDNDGDGVLNGSDKCPDTAPGNVDADGCGDGQSPTAGDGDGNNDGDGVDDGQQIIDCFESGDCLGGGWNRPGGGPGDIDGPGGTDIDAAKAELGALVGEIRTGLTSLFDITPASGAEELPMSCADTQAFGSLCFEVTNAGGWVDILRLLLITASLLMAGFIILDSIFGGKNA